MAVLIAYFSRADENYFGGILKTLKVGNTEVAAGMAQKLTGADIFKIDPVRPYAKDYNTCINEAQADQRANARPELKAYPESLAQYGTVILCYPNYWGTMPMAVFTFLERYAFAGKTILPLCTHEGSGMGHSEADIKRLCPGAKVGKGLAINGSRVNSAEDDIKKWLAANGLI